MEIHRGESAVELAGIECVEEVRDLWLELHHHHREVVRSLPLVEDDELSWRTRRAQYVQRLRAGTAFLALARIEGAVVGYAFVFIEQGPDDTYPVGDQYAELYSLVVASRVRGRGIGTQLLDFVDRELARRAIHDLTVSVMTANTSALRLYERRGLQPAELVMYRFGRGEQTSNGD
jgi:ribosomal protein S18 acetylase RimI-like enzyme